MFYFVTLSFLLIAGINGSVIAYFVLSNTVVPVKCTCLPEYMEIISLVGTNNQILLEFA